ATPKATTVLRMTTLPLAPLIIHRLRVELILDVASLRMQSAVDLLERCAPPACCSRSTWSMAEPCRSCERRGIDWGGCRCQAFLRAGDAGRADPVCALSPDHGIVE